MSNYHVLKQAPDIKTAEVIFHIPIPVGNNSAGISWRAALVKELGGADAITSQLPGITTEELSALKSGALYEVQVQVRFSSTVNITDAQRLQEIKNAFTAETNRIVAEKAITLKFMGLEGNV